jgi:hypothetical protein
VYEDEYEYEESDCPIFEIKYMKSEIVTLSAYLLLVNCPALSQQPNNLRVRTSRPYKLSLRKSIINIVIFP